MNYPTYKIAKGTRLYRKANTVSYYENMFFGFCPGSTVTADDSVSQSEKIQIWESIDEIECPLFLKGKNPNGLGITAIVDVYNFLFLEDLVNDWEHVDIKKKSWPARAEFLNRLRSANIRKWVAPLEDVTHAMELFLFGSEAEHRQLVKFVKYLDENERDDSHDINFCDANFIELLELDVVIFQHHDPNDPLLSFLRQESRWEEL